MVRACLTLIFVLGATSFAGAADEKKPVVLKGSILDNRLEAMAPKNSVVESQKQLEKICKAWGVETPKVDMAQNLVIVGTWAGSFFEPTYKLNDGDLNITWMGSQDEVPGFRFYIATYPRKGVKSVNGKACQWVD